VAEAANIVEIMPTPEPHPIVILAYDGLCLFEFGCAFEVFGLSRPEMGPNWYRCAIAAAEPGALRAVGGVQVVSDGGLELLSDARTIVIPGWRGRNAPVPAPLLQALREAHDRGCRLVSICGGAFVLAQTGLLAGKRATTHWHHIDELSHAFPDIVIEPEVLYVDEGSLMTSA